MTKLLLTAFIAGLLPVLCVAQAPAGQATPSPVPVEAFFKIPAMLKVELSPSGRYLGAISVRDDAKASLVVIDLESNAPARMVASDAKQDVIAFHWVGDERLVLRLGELEPGRVQSKGPGLYAVNVDGSQLEQLVCSDIALCRNQTDLLDFRFQLVHVPRPQPGVRPNEVIVQRLWEPQWLDTRTHALRPVAMPRPPKRTISWWFTSGGEPRLTITYEENRRAFYWLAPGATAWQRIAEFDMLHPPFWPEGVSDDGQLYVMEKRGAAGESVLTTFDFATGAPAKRAVVQVPGFDFSGSLVEGEPGRGLLGVRVDADASSTVWFDEALKQLQAQMDERWPEHVNRITCRRCGQPDMVALVHSTSDRDPGRLRLHRAATKRLETVSVDLPGVDSQRMAGTPRRTFNA